MIRLRIQKTTKLLGLLILELKKKSNKKNETEYYKEVTGLIGMLMYYCLDSTQRSKAYEDIPCAVRLFALQKFDELQKKMLK